MNRPLSRVNLETFTIAYKIWRKMVLFCTILEKLILTFDSLKRLAQFWRDKKNPQTFSLNFWGPLHCVIAEVGGRQNYSFFSFSTNVIQTNKSRFRIKFDVLTVFENYPTSWSFYVSWCYLRTLFFKRTGQTKTVLPCPKKS